MKHLQVVFHGEILKEVPVVFSGILNGHPVIEIRLSGHIGHFPAAFKIHRLSVEITRAGGRLYQPGGHLHPGGFAAAVGAQHRVDMPGFHRHGHTVYGGFCAEFLCQFPAFKHDLYPSFHSGAGPRHCDPYPAPGDL